MCVKERWFPTGDSENCAHFPHNLHSSSVLSLLTRLAVSLSGTAKRRKAEHPAQRHWTIVFNMYLNDKIKRLLMPKDENGEFIKGLCKVRLPFLDPAAGKQPLNVLVELANLIADFPPYLLTPSYQCCRAFPGIYDPARRKSFQEALHTDSGRLESRAKGNFPLRCSNREMWLDCQAHFTFDFTFESGLSLASTRQIAALGYPIVADKSPGARDNYMVLAIISSAAIVRAFTSREFKALKTKSTSDVQAELARMVREFDEGSSSTQTQAAVTSQASRDLASLATNSARVPASTVVPGLVQSQPAGQVTRKRPANFQDVTEAEDSTVTTSTSTAQENEGSNTASRTVSSMARGPELHDQKRRRMDTVYRGVLGARHGYGLPC